MALASLRVVVSGSLAFLVFWLLAVFPSFRPLPLGRTAGAMAGAVLSVALGVLTPTRAYEAVDLSILGLLFGTMVVSLYLQQADLFKYLGHALSWRSYGGRDLLCRTCLLGALSGALFTNDTCCLVLTSFILKLCHRQGLPPLPFLLGLSTSANIGSAATPIGNPQNLVIAALGGIPFSTFFLGLLPSVLLGVLINTLMLLAFYWNQLSPPADPHLLLLHHLGNGSAPMNDAPSSSPRSLLRATKNATPWTPFQSSEELDIPHRILHPATRKGEQPIASDAASNGAGAGDDDDVVLCVNEPGSPLPPQAAATMDPSLAQTLLPNPKSFVREESPWMKMFAWKFAVYFVACAMLAAFLLGYDLSWTSLTAAVCLMALDFRDAGPNLDKVSYLLLVFFTGMFITLDGFNSTGIPDTIWDMMESHARIGDPTGVVVLTLVVLLLCNIASNVPTVILLGARVAESALGSNVSVATAWLFLAWATTTAGNLTLIGSAANLIVSEQAMKAPQLYSYDLTFVSHLKFGLPSTLIVVTAGLPLIMRGTA